MELRWRTLELPLARPFKIATGTTTRARLLVAELEHQGVVGLGEAAPSQRVTGETLESVEHFLKWARGEVRHLAPGAWEKLLDHMHGDICGNPAARAAVDIAMHDLIGKIEGRSVHALYRLPPARLETTLTVSMDEPEVMAQEAREHRARGHRCIKVKLGDWERDAQRIRAVREAVPDATLRADANTQWPPVHAPRLANALAQARFEFLEQPFPANALDELAAFSKRAPIPVYADESCHDEHDVRRLHARGFVGGVNLKLMKTGGIRPMIAAMRAARAAGYRVQIGCNVETGIAITAATHALSLAHSADLDGNLLLANDPYQGVRPRDGWLQTPTRPGLGLPAS